MKPMYVYDKITSLIIALCFLLPFVVFGQLRSPAFIGTRPASMGEAFIAVADDGNALYWNPAAIVRLERVQASFAYADLFGLGINSYYASFISPFQFFPLLGAIPKLNDYFAFGVDWFGIKSGDQELEFSRDQFNFSLAFQPPKSFSFLHHLNLGVNAKYLQLDGKLDGRPEAKASGWGWDGSILYNLGALPYLPKGLNGGLMVYDLGGTEIQHRGGRKEIILQQNTRWGFSFRPFEDWPSGKLPISDPVIALDFDDRVHLGLEFWLVRALALRFGWQKDRYTKEPVTLSFGLGLKRISKVKEVPDVNLDYALTDLPSLPTTSKQFGGSMILKTYRSWVGIADAQMNDVYASLFRHYGVRDAAAGSINLKNNYTDTLTAWVSFIANRYMEFQVADTVKIPPDQKVIFPFRAIFEPTILNAPDGPQAGKVKVTYLYKNTEITSTHPVVFTVHAKNYLTWDDPGKAAAFVTPDEPFVKYFVDEALSGETGLDEASWFSRYNMAEALNLFHALQAYGVQYRLDPVTPFPPLADTLRGAPYRLDKIQYPTELLLAEKRFGDCDDLSVLYASLLQYAGLPTAFVSGPGHLFIMFDTNIPASRIRSLPVSPKLFFERHGTLWIPVETTMIPTSTFTEAWTFAANAIDSTCQIYEVAANQAKYPPVSPGVLSLPTTLPSIPNFAPALQRDLAALEDKKVQWLQAAENNLEREVHNLSPREAAKPRNLYGVILGQNDEYTRARIQFQKVLQDSTFAPAWNNLGNVEFITGNFAAAERAYKKALLCDPASRGTYLNLSILYQMMIEGATPQDSVEYQRQSEAALLKAAQLFEGNAQRAFAMLQFPEESIDGKAGSFTEKIKRRIKQVKTFVDRTFKQYLQKQEIRNVVYDRFGAKGRSEIDQDRTALLSWSY